MKNVLVVGTSALLAFVLATSLVVVQIDTHDRSQRQAVNLTRAVSELEARFFYRHRAELEWLASRPEVRGFLRNPAAGAPVIERLLSGAQGLLGVEVVYLVGPSGSIVAASDPSFPGVSISFRDYFRKGMAGLPAYEMAMGVVTKSKGIYASVPVYDGGTIVGLAVFRTSAKALEGWQSTVPGLVLVDPEGEVFSSWDNRFSSAHNWVWDGPSRVRANGAWYRVTRVSIDPVPGYSALLLAPDDFPWGHFLMANLLVVLLSVTGFFVWRQWRSARARADETRDRQQRELLLSHLMEGIAVFDTEAKLVWSNGAFDRMIQRDLGSRAPTMGELWDRAGTGPWRDVLEGRRPWVVFESVLRGLEGSWTPVSAGFTSAEGRFLLSVLDRTERYQSEQLLRQSQKLTVLGQLSGGIAHDLNNMLGVLMGMADLLKMSLSDHDPLQESVDLILTTLGRASGLSEKMLNFARQTPMVRTSVDLSAVLRELRFLARTALPEGIRAEVAVPEGPLPVTGDENLLLSAFLNLVLNAGEAMPQGGTVTIRGWREEPGRAMVQVEDTGEGMDKATQARIFEPFFTTKSEGGTGLGLSLVRRTILEHRGTIDVRSAPHVGTTVTISLPLSV